jgi:hypothetical protein
MSSLYDFVNQARRRAIRQNERENTVLRALTGAGMLLGEAVRAGGIAEAAVSVAVCPRYLLAAKQVIAANDEALLREVLRGNLPLMTAATHASARLSLIRGFRNAAPSDLKAFATEIGVANIWDAMVVPAI